MLVAPGRVGERAAGSCSVARLGAVLKAGSESWLCELGRFITPLLPTRTFEVIPPTES